MQRYDSDVINEMAKKISLLDYASNMVDFKKRGIGIYATNCPLHIDKTPSLIIDINKNCYRCYSCGVHGNIYNWMWDFEHISFPKALEKVAQLTNSDLNNMRTSETMRFFRQMKNLHTPKTNNTITHEILPLAIMNQYADEIPQEWLDEGINQDVMRLYGVRIDKKANRIVYPIYDNKQNLIAVKGRTRYVNYKDMGLQKYKFYQKIGTLDFFVGWKEAFSFINDRKEVYLFEGIKSCMKAYGWGYQNSVSCETSYISDGQVKQLIQNEVRVVNVCFDSDKDLKEIKKNIKMLKRFAKVYIVTDVNGLLGGKEAKAAPVDKGKEIWEQLLAERRLG